MAKKSNLAQILGQMVPISQKFIIIFIKKKNFSYEQLYVALSIVKALEKLHIECQVTKEAFSEEKDVEYCRLKQQCCLTKS